MKKSFILGATAGATSLAIAVPLLAQLVSAASGTATTTADVLKTRPVPSQVCVQAMADQDTKFLANVDAMITTQKAATKAHHDALVAAAAITDDTARGEAIKAAQEALRTAMDAAFKADDKKAEMEAMKTACGDNHFFMMGGHMGGPGMKFEVRMDGPMGGKLAEKLGMTEAELKAAIDSGKTIEQIATEKGVTLPPRPEGHRKMKGGFMGHPDDDVREEGNIDSAQ